MKTNCFGKIILFAVLSLFSFGTKLQAQTNASLDSLFSAHEVTGFLLLERADGSILCTDSSRLDEQHLPASTFKILNSLIALEEGVLQDSSSVIKWDGVERSWSLWNRDQTLASAIRYSVVWYYQEVARRVGRERMQYWLDTVGYGSAIIGEEIDRFWLDGSLQISPHQQFEFLKRLQAGDLPFSEQTMETVKSIMVRGQGDGWTLYGKTGGGSNEFDSIGWFIGWVDSNGSIETFVTLIQSDRQRGRGTQAMRVSRDALIQHGILPEGSVLR